MLSLILYSLFKFEVLNKITYINNSKHKSYIKCTKINKEVKEINNIVELGRERKKSIIRSIIEKRFLAIL